MLQLQPREGTPKNTSEQIFDCLRENVRIRKQMIVVWLQNTKSQSLPPPLINPCRKEEILPVLSVEIKNVSFTYIVPGRSVAFDCGVLKWNLKCATQIKI
jgi:hypothetical protein